MEPINWRNPLSRALYEIDTSISRGPENFDLLDILPSDQRERAIDNVAAALLGWESLGENRQDYYVQTRAAYLLGLAVGLRYAKVTDDELNRVIDSYKRQGED